jgi:hypothetical protein
MADIIKLGQGILYMKVGTHAQEGLEHIINRKTKEIERAGFAMWGYGGSTCHPCNTVQPFAREFQESGKPIYLCMEEMNSKHFAEQVRADEWSADGQEWNPIPPEISVLGSRYALVIKNLRREDFDLSLRETRVAWGNCTGRPGSKYIKGRVDKACLEITDNADSASEDRSVKINLVADLVDPYAVYLRNRN